MRKIAIDNDYDFLCDDLLENFDSSSVETLAYNGQVQKALCTFKNGNSYVYEDVSENVWLKVKSSASIGRAVNTFLKPLDFQDLDVMLGSFTDSELRRFGMSVKNKSILPLVAPNIY